MDGKQIVNVLACLVAVITLYLYVGNIPSQEDDEPPANGNDKQLNGTWWKYVLYNSKLIRCAN